MGKAKRMGAGLLLGSFLSASPALATSDVWHRYPAMAGVGLCGQGQVVEQVFEGGSVTYGYAKIVAACMTSLRKANWVMLSVAECGDPVRYKPGLCEGKPTKGPLLRIREIAAYAEEDRRSIRLQRATVGRDCTILPSDRDTKWVCKAYEDHKGFDHGVAAGRFKNAQGNFDIPLFGKTVELPLAFDRKAAAGTATAKPRAVAPLPRPEPDHPHWMGDTKHIAYGMPETDAEAALNCVAPGKVDLWVFDPGQGKRPFKSWEGTVEALGRSERVPFRLHKGGDGDSLVFSVPADGLVLASLMQDRDFQVTVPTGEKVSVTGKGAGKLAAAMRAACAPPPRPILPEAALPTMRMP